MKANANPRIQAAFTMRDIVTDTASAMLQAVLKGRTAILEIFFDYGFVPKQAWFRDSYHDSPAWQRAAQLAQKVPSLKSLTRKAIKNSISRAVGIPTNQQLRSLELPRSLTEYIAFL